MKLHLAQEKSAKLEHKLTTFMALYNQKLEELEAYKMKVHEMHDTIQALHEGLENQDSILEDSRCINQAYQERFEEIQLKIEQHREHDMKSTDLSPRNHNLLQYLWSPSIVVQQTATTKSLLSNYIQYLDQNQNQRKEAPLTPGTMVTVSYFARHHKRTAVKNLIQNHGPNPEVSNLQLFQNQTMKMYSAFSGKPEDAYAAIRMSQHHNWSGSQNIR
jgi:uncharacterized protein